MTSGREVAQQARRSLLEVVMHPASPEVLLAVVEKEASVPAEFPGEACRIHPYPLLLHLP